MRLPGATHLVILIDAERRSDWLVKAVDRRLREEFAKLGVAINEDKSRMVNYGQRGLAGSLAPRNLYRRVRLY